MGAYGSVTSGNVCVNKGVMNVFKRVFLGIRGKMCCSYMIPTAIGKYPGNSHVDWWPRHWQKCWKQMQAFDTMHSIWQKISKTVWRKTYVLRSVPSTQVSIEKAPTYYITLNYFISFRNAVIDKKFKNRVKGRCLKIIYNCKNTHRI